LDSLRGLAALSVVFNHFLNLLPSIAEKPKEMWLMKYTPLHIFWAGHEAVIFFFILSGFVLSLQFFNKKVDYRSFFVKRVCRIYLPYITCVIIAIIASQIFYTGYKQGLSAWFNSVWTVKPSWGLVAQHFLLITYFDNKAFDPVLWSLVHEMRISIMFPLIMLCILKFNWKINIGFAVLATGICMVLTFIGNRLQYYTDYFVTIHYIAMFIFGALLAKHRKEILAWYTSKSKPLKIGLILTGVPLYLFPWLLKIVLTTKLWFVEEWVISLGVAIFIISALGSQKVSLFLLSRSVHFLGQISYSMYLLHAVILISVTQILYKSVGLLPIWPIAMVSTLFFSWLSYKYIEIPSINIGKLLADRMLKVKQD
jgi:peptidoglycan/LPS O-acetylase OafA/YrhL